MAHVLIERLTQELGYEEVSLDNHDSFTRHPGLNVLFFPGNPETVKDATDVAVVLPELIGAFFPGRFHRREDHKGRSPHLWN